MYELLYAHFGPQYWWPGESSFEIMIGAILTQNTNWANVEKAISNLKSHDVLALQKMQALHDDELMHLIRPAGFFRVKAMRIRSFISYLINEYDGNIEQMRDKSLTDLRMELLQIHGIGKETADSMLLYALNKPIFVVDTYTKRIFERHDLCDSDIDYDELQSLIMRHIEPSIALYNEFHALIVMCGKTFCRPTPKCDQCPLQCMRDCDD